MEQYLRQGLVSDIKVLDIRQVDVSAGKVLENEIPVFVVSFTTQEVLLFRNVASGEVVVGAEVRVELEQCMYAAVITRVPDSSSIMSSPAAGKSSRWLAALGVRTCNDTTRKVLLPACILDMLHPSASHPTLASTYIHTYSRTFTCHISNWHFPGSSACSRCSHRII